jgi:hypothetical protein
VQELLQAKISDKSRRVKPHRSIRHVLVLRSEMGPRCRHCSERLARQKSAKKLPYAPQ